MFGLFGGERMDIENLDIAEFMSSEPKGEDDGLFLKDALLFETGKHRGKEFTTQDLQILAQSFNPDNPIPVQLDHSSSTKDTVGFVRKVWIEGQKLFGQLEIVDDTIQNRIKKGLSKKLSIGFYTDKGKPSSLREVSIVAFPQVKTATILREELEDGGEQDMENEKKLVELQEAVEKYQQQLEQYEELEKELTAMREAKAKAEAEKVVSEFSEKMVPAQVDIAEKLVVSFTEEQLELFKQFMEIEEKVEFIEKGEVDHKEELSEQEKADKAYAKWKEALGL